jgi:hypothetical protein
MLRNMNKKWTQEDDGKLLQMRAAEKPFFVIGAALKRSAAAVAGRYGVLKAKRQDHNDEQGAETARI